MNDGVALYLRVSTEDQDLDGQERELRAYAAVKGWTVVAVYREKISATGRVVRDQYEQLRSDSTIAHPDLGWGHVLVWAIDRWSRDPSFVQAIGSVEALERLGIQWHSFKEPALDSGGSGPEALARDLLRGILPTIASFESRRRSDRTLIAMREIKAGRRSTKSGRPPGRPRRVTPELVSRAWKLRQSGKGWGEVARLVGLKTETARRAVLRWRTAGGDRAKPPAAQKGLASDRPT